MSRSARKEGLSRRHRFALQGSFGPILRGSSKLRGSLAVLHVALGRSGVSRLGVALTRRIAPSAVVRNRIKRAVRVLFRRHPAKSAGLDLVVALRSKPDAAGVGDLCRELAELFDQAIERPAK